jgi:hypothetical protein
MYKNTQLSIKIKSPVKGKRLSDVTLWDHVITNIVYFSTNTTQFNVKLQDKHAGYALRQDRAIFKWRAQVYEAANCVTKYNRKVI